MRFPRRPRRTLGAALAGLLLATVGVTALSSPAVAAVSIPIDGSSGGRTFDGVGAVSGGGGNSRLLYDYPEAQRSQILDYLFKPNYGAALQILKVEIGGDTNSTSGAEPSHAHFRGDLNCDRGYEWWIMEQAKARNPGIKLVGLPWGAPGWIGNGNILSTDMINYLLSWLGCAKQHNLTIDYLTAGQNEKKYDPNWTISLRNALNSNGYGAVKIIYGDSWPGDWSPANTVVNNSALKSAIDVLSAHYVCGYLSAQSTCTVPANATNSGETLWNSEGGSQDYNDGAGPLARGINRGYLDGRLTAYLNWDLIASITPNLPWATVGLILANQPWSGWYAVGKDTWTLAHTTQFTAPGWKYLDRSSGFIGGNRNNGSYVSLKSANNTDYSTIIETMDATGAQQMDFTVGGGLSTGPVHVWRTNLNSSNTADHFVHSADITPSGGAFSLTVQPGYVYTITTTTGQGKGTATSPGQGSLGLPYTDNFESYAAGRFPRYLQDMQGAFETTACGGGRSGMCLRQASPQAPITWKTLSEPNTYGGNLAWNNYTLSADVMLENAGYAQLEGRVGTTNLDPINRFNGYFLRAQDTGAWSILRNNTSGQLTTLRSGTTATLGTGRWHNLKLTFNGSSITAVIDGTTVGSVSDSTFGSGQVGFGTSQGETAQFDNLQVYNGTPPVDPTPTPSPSTSPSSSPSPSPSTPAGGCSATYKITSSWSGGFQGEVTVTNNAEAASTGWRTGFTYADGQQVSQFWSTDLTQNGATVTASNVSYNGALAPGSSTTYGFLASQPGSANTAPAVTCTLR
ncbi:cellulose binding domain-containing protein [Actinoplanes subtropicus]|uniref:cellulose binding domain-containing protein n=1 Tax=Actinoplanes subtropicus TaxID=543632 RepID=UPI000A0284D0|nr:cellulose binding domain-containing protein [Actinoplanes subtropicus]